MPVYSRLPPCSRPRPRRVTLRCASPPPACARLYWPRPRAGKMITPNTLPHGPLSVNSIDSGQKRNLTVVYGRRLLAIVSPALGVQLDRNHSSHHIILGHYMLLTSAAVLIDDLHPENALHISLLSRCHPRRRMRTRRQRERH